MKLIIKNRITESNIQAEFYFSCKMNNINCYLEYKINQCRFDAVIYNNEKEILAIIEVKSYTTNKEPKRNTKQIKKYSEFALPIFMISRLDQIESIINEIKKLL
jgi:type I site-specific restriction endonuclease